MTTRSPSELADLLGRSTGTLTTAALAAMDEQLDWFAELGAEHRASIGGVAHSGITAFLDWLRAGPSSPEQTPSLFAMAPQVLARVVNLQQTVSLVRVTITVVGSEAESLCSPDDLALLRTSVAAYTSEIAFAAAEVYARAAESRGAWDARLEALAVDSVVRGDVEGSVRSRAAALGWDVDGPVVVVVGAASDSATMPPEIAIEDVHRTARHLGLGVMCSVQGDRLVAVLGGVHDADAAAAAVTAHCGPGPVVVGPTVAGLDAATESARVAVAAWRAAPGWAAAPRPVRADDLLPERALSGERRAAEVLVEDVWGSLTAGDGVLATTVAAFVETGCSVEAAARRLFVHPNTVRYRLRKVADVSGLNPHDPREAFTLQVALTLARIGGVAAGAQASTEESPSLSGPHNRTLRSSS